MQNNRYNHMGIHFVIRRADESDVPEIMTIMNEAKNDMAHPEWFVADDENYMREHLQGKGYVIVAESPIGGIAGFFVVKYPEDEENLGTYLEFDREQLAHVAVMDSAVVGSVYRGNGLQEQMLEAAESLLDKEKYYYLMCTIHPDNEFSRNNMESHGYKVKKIALCYGGLPRCILLKNLRKC